MNTISTLASEALAYFERRHRDSGEVYVTHRAPDGNWVYQLVREAHGDMMPDDWRYAAIEAVLGALAENNFANADAARDNQHAICAGLVDVYTADLTEWLHSSTARLGYVDEARFEGFIAADADEITRLQIGQFLEFFEIYGLVVDALEGEQERREQIADSLRLHETRLVS